MAFEEEEPIREDAEALRGYAQWLARLEVGVADVVAIERLQGFMERRFAQDEMFAPTGRQVQAVFGAKQAVYRFQEAGLKPFNSKTAIGSGLRFGISNMGGRFPRMPGAFGLIRAREIFSERTGSVAPF